MEKIDDTQQNEYHKQDFNRLKWFEFMRTSGWEISKEDAEKIQKSKNISVMYDLHHPQLPFEGYFGVEPESDSILLITECGYFLRDSHYLVKSEDDLVVCWVEELDPLIILGDKGLPNLEDEWEIKGF